MNSRALLAIVVIGLLGMASMGMMTKYIFENNQGLQEVVQFKASVLREFGERGIHEVNYRRQRQPRGIRLRLVADASRISDADPVHRSIAESFAEAFPRERYDLTLAYFGPSTVGCAPSEPFLETTFSMREVREDLRFRSVSVQLGEELRVHAELELLGLERDSSEITVRVLRQVSEANPKEDLVSAGRVAARVLSLGRRGMVTVELVEVARREELPGQEEVASSPDEAPSGTESSQEANGDESTKLRTVAEGRFDFRGRLRRR